MKKVIATIAALAFAAPVFAQALDFDTVDADGSGAISFEELQAVMPDVTQEQFDAADTDGSGDLSPEEFATAIGG